VIVDGHGGPVTKSTPSGYGPADLQAAYGVTGSSGGAGQTVAIVDAYDNPTAESDLAAYRSYWGLPAVPSFKKVNQTGGSTAPKANSSWAQEIALDLDMVSAICPSCNILLVEANSASSADLAAAVNTAASLGANAISNSYGATESSSDATYASSYDHPGVAITASTGDSGYGVQSPASYATVTAVGGTSLKKSSTASRGWTETAWSGAGAGCSGYVAKPVWQSDTGCSMRTVADVSAVADPYTGVAVYITTHGRGSWLVFGGTSAASPIIAAMYALAGNTSSLTGAEDGAYLPYAHSSQLNDPTSGSDGSCGGTYLCSAGVGYDGPTGLGTPNGTGAF